MPGTGLAASRTFADLPYNLHRLHPPSSQVSEEPSPSLQRQSGPCHLRRSKGRRRRLRQPHQPWTRCPQGACYQGVSSNSKTLPSYSPDFLLSPLNSRKLVVLASGTLGTPQILERSGVGKASLLKELGIPVVSDLPGVRLSGLAPLLAPLFAVADPASSRSSSFFGHPSFSGRRGVPGPLHHAPNLPRLQREHHHRRFPSRRQGDAGARESLALRCRAAR